MAKKKKHTPSKQKPEPAFLLPELTFPLVLFLFAFLLYSNTLHHGFVMDDGAVITGNETVKKGFGGIKELFGQSSVYGSTKENFGTYRPLTMSFFAMEWNFFKDNPLPYHFIHILLYACLSVVIFLVLKKLLRNYHPLLPFLSSLLFTAHAVHTEVAANLKSADEILSLLFCLLALFHAAGFMEKHAAKPAVFSFLAFLCALFSKESSAAFLVIIQLALFLFSPGRRKRQFIIFGIHLAALAIYLAARSSALDAAPEEISVINNTLAGAQSPAERYATVLVILLNYLKLLFFPHPLSWDYGYNQIPLTGSGDPAAWLSAFIHLALAGFSLVFLLRRAASPAQKLFSFCILFYLAGLSVSSNIFVLIGSTMAERFLFTPSLGFCTALAWLLLRTGQPADRLAAPGSLTWSLVRSTRAVSLAPIAVLLVLHACKTWSRNQDWKSNLTLFAKGAEVCPGSYRTNTTFAWESVLAGEKETDPEKKKMHLRNAVAYYKKGLAIYNKVEADWYNYGVSNSNLGNLEEAVRSYREALKLNPEHRNSLYNLATVYLSKNDFSNSLPLFLRAYQIEPDFMDVAFKVGLIYHMGGHPKEAIPYYERYFRNNPGNRDVVNNLSMAWMAAGNMERAAYYRNLLEKMKK